MFVPGLPGSNLLDAATGERIFLDLPESFLDPLRDRLKGPDDLSDMSVVAGAPVGSFSLPFPLSLLASLFMDLKQSESLYEILRPLYPPGEFSRWSVRFGWDWRRPIWDGPMLERLANEITALSVEHQQPVVMLVHSTGGLVLRYLLEHYFVADVPDPARRAQLIARIGRIISLGVPWAGTLKTLKAFTAQEGLGALVSPDKAQEILGRSWAAFDLAPPDPASAPAGVEYPELLVNEVGQSSPLADRRWMPDRPAIPKSAMELRSDASTAHIGARTPEPDFGGIPVTNVAGWGYKTTVGAELIPGAAPASVVFEDRVDTSGFDDGDGTIPSRSAAWLEGSGVTTLHQPIGIRGAGPISVQKHITLWNNEACRNALRYLIAGVSANQEFVTAVVDWRERTDPLSKVHVRCAANGFDGSLLEDAHVRFRRPSLSDEPRFQLAHGGRMLLEIDRSAIPISTSGTFRVLELEIRWRKGGVVQSSDPFRFFLTP